MSVPTSAPGMAPSAEEPPIPGPATSSPPSPASPRSRSTRWPRWPTVPRRSSWSWQRPHGHGLGFTLPVTLAIAFLLAVLVASYRQVIAAFPDGGGSYAVARAHLGRRTSLVAAASLVLDYVLNVAVAVTAGVAALTSALPGLHDDRVWLCLGVLALITGVNLRGIADSARTFVVPTAVFIGSVLAVIAVGLFRSAPVSTEVAAGHASALSDQATTVGGRRLRVCPPRVRQDR